MDACRLNKTIASVNIFNIRCALHFQKPLQSQNYLKGYIIKTRLKTKSELKICRLVHAAVWSGSVTLLQEQEVCCLHCFYHTRRWKAPRRNALQLSDSEGTTLKPRAESMYAILSHSYVHWIDSTWNRVKTEMASGSGVFKLDFRRCRIGKVGWRKRPRTGAKYRFKWCGSNQRCDNRKRSNSESHGWFWFQRVPAKSKPDRDAF